MARCLSPTHSLTRWWRRLLSRNAWKAGSCPRSNRVRLCRACTRQTTKTRRSTSPGRRCKSQPKGDAQSLKGRWAHKPAVDTAPPQRRSRFTCPCCLGNPAKASCETIEESATVLGSFELAQDVALTRRLTPGTSVLARLPQRRPIARSGRPRNRPLRAVHPALRISKLLRLTEN